MLTHADSCWCQVGRGDDAGSVLVGAKEASELEELLAFFELGLGESEQFATALQVIPPPRGSLPPLPAL